jgi:phosphoglucosamine mutase
VSLRFGTDGIRGVAGRELSPELVMALGRVSARELEGGSFVVGRDTRLSGPLLQAAFSAGVASEGVDVIDVGVLPTPAVAAVAAWLKSPAAVISASHNPYTDNGVKLFAAGGRKLSDQEEAAVEAGLVERAASSQVARLGTIGSDPEWRPWYCTRLVEALDGRSLGGLPVVLDCAHGAASATAADVFRAAGADVVEVLSASPDGTNINAGSGSTDPSALQAAVVARRAAAGLAFDGDADRVIAVDERGQVVDGDRLMALFAVDLEERGRLAGHTVVATVMTNLGFHRAMAAAGIAVHQTPVGDRYVLEALDGHGWSLGGEQSGHIVFRDLATTGDGVLSGLLLLDLLRRRDVRLAEAAESSMDRFPQVLRNVEVADPGRLHEASRVWAEVDAVSLALGDTGRVLLRPSGTERLVRIMVEAPTAAEAEAVAGRLAAVVTETLSA